MYVVELSEKAQAILKAKLVELGFNEQEIQDGMDSRVCDLSDTIDLDAFLEEIKGVE